MGKIEDCNYMLDKVFQNYLKIIGLENVDDIKGFFYELLLSFSVCTWDTIYSPFEYSCMLVFKNNVYIYT